MPEPLRILLVEDSPDDAELIVLHLRTHGTTFTHHQVDSLQGFHAALRSGPWDLVLSDFSLPGTDGLEVLKCLRDHDPDLPFILLSGVLDEGAAVAAMRNGANDFLLKQNLARLVPAIERETKEAELRRKQRQFVAELHLLHTAIAQTPDMVVITDSEGVIVYTNAAAEAITGYRREEMLGQNPRLFKGDLHDLAFYQTMWEALLRGETWKGHITNRRKDGSLWEAEAVISPVFGARGELQNYLLTSRDVTHERQLQGLLEQSQRLETIGTLTSGIAHDFNNILMPVLGHAELGLARRAGDPQLRHDLEVIQTSVHRAKDLIRQILAFSQKGQGELVPVELQSLLAESLKLLRATVPSSIAFEVTLEAPGKSVLGDPTKLHQIMLNLGTNAAQAMRGSAGRLTVRLCSEHLSAMPCAMNTLLPEGEYLCLEVTDTGRGIPPEHLDKIFLPFFTTKPPQEGTGLGLSVTHGLIGAMRGGIQVTSQPGEGTSFKVYLPLASPGPCLAGSDEGEGPVGHGHVLLVDDETALLEMLHTSLVKLGFRVSSYRDPQSALRAFLWEPESFQVLVTDLTMPHMSGELLAEAIWAVTPDLPAILLSGDPELEKAVGSVLLAKFRACLIKPMSPKDIAKAILRALSDGAQPTHSGNA